MLNWFFEKKEKSDQKKIEEQSRLEAQRAAEAEQHLQQQRDIIIKEEKEFLSASDKRIKQLKKYADMLNNELLTNIYHQTLILHNIFRDDTSLERKKLEQHHYYYTDNLLIELKNMEDNIAARIKNSDIKRQKVDKTLEVLRSNFNDNIKINRDYTLNFVTYAKYMASQLSTLYNIGVDGFVDYRYIDSAKLIHIGKRVNPTHVYFGISREMKNTLIKKPENAIFIGNNNAGELCVTKNFKELSQIHYGIDEDLLKDLYEDKFLIEYVGILKYDTETSNAEYIEIFKDVHTSKYFYYNVFSHTFGYISDAKVLKTVMVHENSKVEQLKREIEFQESELRVIENEKENALLDQFTVPVRELLKDILVKIDDIEFIEELKTVSIDTQKLRAVLNLEKMVI